MSFPTTSEGPSEEAAAAWESTRERHARITWSLIAEPSDAVAMLACAVLGPVDALELARHGSGPDLLRALGGQQCVFPCSSTSGLPYCWYKRIPG